MQVNNSIIWRQDGFLTAPFWDCLSTEQCSTPILTIFSCLFNIFSTLRSHYCPQSSTSQWIICVCFYRTALLVYYQTKYYMICSLWSYIIVQCWKQSNSITVVQLVSVIALGYNRFHLGSSESVHAMCQEMYYIATFSYYYVHPFICIEFTRYFRPSTNWYIFFSFHGTSSIQPYILSHISVTWSWNWKSNLLAHVSFLPSHVIAVEHSWAEQAY
jgi:hypothetical protein